VHKAVHYIEHAPQVRRDLVEYLVIRGRAAKLTELSRGVEARILTILEPKPVFVARLYGVDLLPGRRIQVLAKGPHVFLIGVGSEEG